MARQVFVLISLHHHVSDILRCCIVFDGIGIWFICLGFEPYIIAKEAKSAFSLLAPLYKNVLGLT